MARIEPFERYASEYEDWFERNHIVYISELQAIKNQLPANGKKVEIGVGTGRFAAPLGIKLGLEPSLRMGDMARRRGIRVVSGVAEAIPFAAAQFDVALMVTTICFLDNLGDAFGEACRILKPGGYFIAGFVDRNSILGQLYEEKKKASKFYRLASFYSVDAVVSRLKRAGFRNFNFVQTIFHPPGEIQGIESVRDGYGQGSFVVIRAQK